MRPPRATLQVAPARPLKMSPEGDPIGCAGQAAKNVSPESDPIGCAGQAAKKVDSESFPDVSQSVVSQPAGTELHPAAPGMTIILWSSQAGRSRETQNPVKKQKNKETEQVGPETL